MKNNILILGNNDSIWLQFYIENVFRDKLSECQLTVFGDFDEKLKIFCDKLGINYIFPDPSSLNILQIPILSSIVKRLHIKRLQYYAKALMTLRRMNSIDVIHIHFVTIHKLRISKLLRKKTKKVVCTYWGSDLLRKNNRKLKNESRYLDIVDKFTFSSSDMINYFKTVYGEKYSDKISLIRFGIEFLDLIDTSPENVTKSKLYFNIPCNKVSITVGYNGIQQQQHLKVIDILKSYPQEIKNKIFVIFPMSYGLTDSYFDIIKKELDNCGFEYKIFLDFMESHDLARLRMATDIFVHSQTTDALSASVQEYLYCKKIVFNPVWINYSILKDNKVFYYEYSDFTDLKRMLLQFISAPVSEEVLSKFYNNNIIIKRISSWEFLVPLWLECYKDSN